MSALLIQQLRPARNALMTHDEACSECTKADEARMIQAHRCPEGRRVWDAYASELAVLIKRGAMNIRVWP